MVGYKNLINKMDKRASEIVKEGFDMCHNNILAVTFYIESRIEEAAEKAKSSTGDLALIYVVLGVSLTKVYKKLSKLAALPEEYCM